MGNSQEIIIEGLGCICAYGHIASYSLLCDCELYIYKSAQQNVLQLISAMNAIHN